MRNRKTRPLKKAEQPLDIVEPAHRHKPQSYRNSPLVYLQNGPKKKRYRQKKVGIK